MALTIKLYLVAILLFHHKMFCVSMPPAKGPEKSCVIMLDESTELKWIKSHEICFQELGPVSLPHVPASAVSENPQLEEFYQYDDMCFAECIYRNLDVLNEDGGVMWKGLGHALKSNMTESMMEEANGYWNQCIDDAEQVVAAHGSSSDLCKTVLLHRFCFEGKLKDLFRNCK